ncbi:hypothetical protein JDV02_004971 [Purpureocillium takamizusanense]|uniref:Arrestin n=1 Tax=Purpureocillium takamizusanense TaxID=2060973 RepID=A0A9Q8QFN2_9HYPO|nr:uncharacterized protein JDV02_004971 [Purpureocillium takamizusanense]UNI18718.1 hypothetical protein JDV02_004971 [Purpureocillium takamizusanense]
MAALMPLESPLADPSLAPLPRTPAEFPAPLNTTLLGTSYGAKNCVVKINVFGHHAAKAFTTGELIRGTVNVTAPIDIPFRTITITLVGCARTTSYMGWTGGPKTYRIPLIRAPMLPYGWLPDPAIEGKFTSKTTYRQQFSFVIPEQLPSFHCFGACSNPDAAERHKRFHPTTGNFHLDDLAPTVTNIIYYISVEAVLKEGDDPKMSKLFQASYPLPIFPYCPDEPPRIITNQDVRYNMCNTKKLRRWLMPFSRSLGTLTAVASQPPAIMMNAHTLATTPTCARINLLFTPTTRGQGPPHIGSIKVALKACTFFSTRPMDCIPDMGDAPPALTASIPLEYSTKRVLVTVFPDAPSWKREQCEKCRGQGSPSSSVCFKPSLDDMGLDKNDAPMIDTREVPEGEEQQHRPPTVSWPIAPPEHRCEYPSYQALLRIRFGLENQKGTMFLPTFYSCTIARTYKLKLRMIVGPARHTMKFGVPLQIGVERYSQSKREPEPRSLGPNPDEGEGVTQHEVPAVHGQGRGEESSGEES